jgi:hypothetical protein
MEREQVRERERTREREREREKEGNVEKENRKGTYTQLVGSFFFCLLGVPM